jgi:hypothetical protein
VALVLQLVALRPRLGLFEADSSCAWKKLLFELKNVQLFKQLLK